MVLIGIVSPIDSKDYLQLEPLFCRAMHILRYRTDFSLVQLLIFRITIFTVNICMTLLLIILIINLNKSILVSVDV